MAARHRHRLRRRLGPADAWRDHGLTEISPFDHFVLTGDDEPLHALLRRTGNQGFPAPSPELPEPTLLHACITLGNSLGASAADGLREMFREALERKPRRWSDAPEGAVERGRALWRVTGTAEEVLAGLDRLTARSADDVYQTPGGIEALALLAEVTAAHPPAAQRVAQLLRACLKARIRHGNSADAMATVRILWQLTAAPQDVVQALIDLIGICPPPGSPGTTVLDPLRLLAEAAALEPTSVTPVLPVLHALLDTDERPVRHDHWAAVHDDETLQAAIRAVLTAAADRTAGPGSARVPSIPED